MGAPFQTEQGLRTELRRARERLAGLEQELAGVDAELEDLATERQQHELLQEACAALEKLDQLGGTALFWGERTDPGASARQIRHARGRVDAFQTHLAEIEGRRQAVVEKIRIEEGNADLLAADVLDAREEQERRKLEWVVERQLDLPTQVAVMPWSSLGEDDERLRRSLAASLLLSLLLALVMPLIDLPLPEPWEVEEVPERLARLIREERPPPQPAPVWEQPVVEEKPEPVEELAEESAPEPVPQQAPEQSPAAKGILAFRETFAGLAEGRTAPRLGAQARISNSGAAPAGLPQRSMVATRAPGSSGGINVATLSRDLGGGGGQIEGVQVARASSSIGGATGSERPRSGGPSLSRTDEEIQIVFDRHKAALYRLYNRELRKDPTLKGQMVLRLTIEPDGSVSLCELNASDMRAPQLAAQVVARVQTFDFGAKEGIPAVTILYPIDFLPAT